MGVPMDPGVPPLINALAATSTVLLVSDAVGLFLGVFDPGWGIFLDGSPVVVAESVISMEYKQEFVVADFPLEQGAFESYNKVQVPYDARVRFSAGGSEQARQDLLDSIQAIVGDLNFYDVVTPTQVYLSANIVHQDYRRTSQNGVGLIQVDVYLQEVRVPSDDGFSGFGNTQSPTGADQQNGGTVQPTSATPSQSAAAATASAASVVAP